MSVARVGFVMLAALAMANCGGSESNSSREPVALRPRPPLSPAATSRADLETKVGPLVELSATPKGEPGRYDRLGVQRFNALNSLSPTVALYIAASRECGELVNLDTRQSSRDELVWRGRCENGNVFTVFEEDARVVRPKLRGSLSYASISALPPPETGDGNEPGELDWLGPCVTKIRAGLKDGETFLHDEWKLGRRRAGHRTLVISGKISTNAFNEHSARFGCDGDVATGQVLEITR